ncbi:MAG: cyclic nucleotide-binding domain-containing protein, partial [Acidobacteriota bacterium]|nr:cyclic nucleotide-binding domain-containing protein [Acidobacteriota bacterium]
MDRFLADALRSTSLFSDLSDRQLSRLAGASTLRRYPPDSEIFTGGQEARAFYLVLSGAVKVYLLSSEGREQILHI